jgi:glycosyltransferase involved in cell wall biosynthesis
MQVLIITQEYPPKVGGAGVVAKQNAEGLAARGHKVTVLTRDWGFPTNPDSAVRLIRVGGMKKLWPFFFSMELLSLNLDRFDVIILNDIGAALVFSTFFLNTSHVSKTVIYLHGSEPQWIFQKPKASVKYFGFSGRYVRLVESCKAIIAVSHYMKEFFLESFPCELEKERIQVVYAGIDQTLFYPRTTDLYDRLGIPSDRTLLLSVSRITKEKGYAAMLGVFAEVIAECSEFHWIVVGEGSYLKEFKEEVAAQNLSGHVTCLGAVARDELPRFYSGADLYWLLSKREAFGLVYAEAQACGTPTLGPRRCGIAEAVREGTSGYLVDNAKECASIILAGEYKSLDRNGIVSFAEQFHLGKQTEKLEAVL